MQVLSVSMIYIRAKFQEDLDAAIPVARTRMERCVSVTVGCIDVCAALHQPARELVGTLMERQCGLFVEASARIDVLGIKQEFQLLQAALRQERLEILRQ
jgi:hypothetical protein